MDGFTRAYVWGQVFAAKLSIHGFTVADAATEADAAVIEFDKRNFEETAVEDRAMIIRLEGELDAAKQQNEKDTAEIAQLSESLKQAKS